MPNKHRRAEDKSHAMRYRVVRAVRDHPRITWGTLAAIGSVLALIASGATWLSSHLVWNSELVIHQRHDATVEAYNAVKIDSLRVERLGDEVDQLKLQGAFVPLKPLEAAKLELWQKKLAAAALTLAADQAKAKESTLEDMTH